MAKRQRRTDVELQELSVHVLWHVRQLCRLAAHLHRRRSASPPTELVDPVDAAALEAFLMHARALIEFLWREPNPPRGQRAPRQDDGLAADFFDEGAWPVFDDQPEFLKEVSRRVGWGVVHVSYRRLEPEEAWGWDHAAIVLHIYVTLLLFAAAKPERLTPGFRDQVVRELQDELGLESAQAMREFGLQRHPVATPAHAHAWIPRS